MNNKMADGQGLNYRVAGQGAPVILIHGMGSSLDGWDLLRPALLQAGYQVLALDLPGHGDSPKPTHRGAYHIETIYNQVETWISGLNLAQPASFVGHSMGGYLSCLLALRRPQWVRALVLVDPFYTRSQLFPVMRWTVDLPGLSARIFRSSPRWALRSVVTWLKNHTTKIPTHILRQMMVDLGRAAPQILFTAPTIEDLLPRAAQIEVPTLVLWGQNDLTLAPESFPPLVEALPEGRGHALPACGHIPHLSHFETFNRLVLDFLAQQSPNGKPEGVPPPQKPSHG